VRHKINLDKPRELTIDEVLLQGANLGNRRFMVCSAAGGSVNLNTAEGQLVIQAAAEFRENACPRCQLVLRALAKASRTKPSRLWLGQRPKPSIDNATRCVGG